MVQHRCRWPWVVLFVAAVLVAVGVSIPQVRSYVTHLRGSPTHTWALEPYPPGAEPVLRLAVVGDVGHPGNREAATVAAIEQAGAARPYDAIILLGDNVYPRGDPDRLDDTVFGPFDDLLDGGAQLWPILGNHDVMDGHAAANVGALGMPGRWYAKELGDLLFIGLDSNDLSESQVTWLEDTLAHARARWKVIALHHPPYSAGYQGSSLRARRIVAPIAAQYGVHLVLSGHDHDYQRSKPIDGVTYLVSGAGADTRRTGTASFTATSASWHHFVDLSVYPDHLRVRAVNQDVRVFDEHDVQAVT